MKIGKLNNKNRILIILIIFFIYIMQYYKSYANTFGTVYVESNKDVIDVGEEIEISINIENFKTAAYTLYLYFDEEKFQYVEGPENINVDGSRIVFVWYDEQGGSGAKNGELVKFKFKGKEKGLATFIIDGNFYSEKRQEVETEFKEKQVQIGKEETNLEKQARKEVGLDDNLSNSKLQNLRLGIEGMVPNFNKDINNYYLTINSKVKDIEVLATSENKEAEVQVIGNKDLKGGLNLIKIQITSPDKTSNSTYLINVTKTNDIEAANTNLETLAIENTLLYPAFNTNVTNYNAEVSNNLERVNLLAIPEDEKASIEIKRDDVLNEGNNEIRIIVTARNGYTKKEYLINVYKRNSDEEEKYIQEQENNQEKLNEIEVEKTSRDENKVKEANIEINEEEGKENRNRLVAFITLIAIVLILASITILFKKRKTKNQNKIF